MKKEMTQEERLDYLVEAFKADSDDYQDLQTPSEANAKKRLLRSLMNIRMPGYMPENVVKIQDEYLRGLADEKGAVELADIPEIMEGLSGHSAAGRMQPPDASASYSVWKGL